MKSRKIIMAQIPSGMLKPQDFRLVYEDIAPLRDGQMLIQVLYTLIDPIIRGWMVNWFGFANMRLGDPILAMGVGRVVESRNPRHRVGDIVSGMFGWREFAVTDGKTIGLDQIRYGDQIMPIRRHDPSLPITYPIGVLGVSTMTAYFGVIHDAPPRMGQGYLVSGASGSVGSVAGQIAKMHGARVIGLAGSEEKRRWLIDVCGYDEVINYRRENVEERIKALFPNGVEIFFDNVGGPILDNVLEYLAVGATVLLCGATATYNSEGIKPECGPKNYFNICLRRATMKGTYCVDFHEQYPAAQEEVVRWLREGKLAHRETIASGLENCPNSLIGLFQGESIGKYFVKVSE